MNTDQLARGNRLSQDIKERERILEFFQERKDLAIKPKAPIEKITRYLNDAPNLGSQSHKEKLATDVVEFIIKREQEAIAALNKEFESL